MVTHGQQVPPSNQCRVLCQRRKDHAPSPQETDIAVGASRYTWSLKQEDTPRQGHSPALAAKYHSLVKIVFLAQGPFIWKLEDMSTKLFPTVALLYLLFLKPRSIIYMHRVYELLVYIRQSMDIEWVNGFYC